MTDYLPGEQVYLSVVYGREPHAERARFVRAACPDAPKRRVRFLVVVPAGGGETAFPARYVFKCPQDALARAKAMVP